MCRELVVIMTKQKLQKSVASLAYYEQMASSGQQVCRAITPPKSNLKKYYCIDWGILVCGKQRLQRRFS